MDGYLFGKALFFIRKELTALYTFTQYLMMMVMMMMYTCVAQSSHAIVSSSSKR